MKNFETLNIHWMSRYILIAATIKNNYILSKHGEIQNILAKF